MVRATIAPTSTAAANRACQWCAGTGWADPWELGDGSPQLVTCDRCLGAGLPDCQDCDGDGAVAVPMPCPCEAPAAA